MEFGNALRSLAWLERARMTDYSAQVRGHDGIVVQQLIVVVVVWIGTGQHESEQSAQREHVRTRVGFGKAILLG